jgi:hypothetical protein
LLLGVAAMGAVGCRSDALPTSPAPNPAAATGGRGGSKGTGGRSGSAGTGGSAMPMSMGTPDAPVDHAADVSAPDVSADLTEADVPADVVVAETGGTPDLRPDLPRDLAPDVLPRNQANGMPCEKSNQCTSGFCADGVCCNSACGNPCQACTMAKTGGANGKCAANTQMAGMKCGRGCQQFPGQTLLVVVDKVCTAAGQCTFPQIPQAPEYCVDDDACTSNSCVQDSEFSARCAKTSKCTGNACCCVSGNSRACMAKSSCTGTGKMCM